ncbi:MAG TPA: HAD family phosphatase [Candidatus Peregrinibacteria bacterium]|nr:HAD family phosphatase [Candidatus Peregrinibacteria bacterium]
MKSVSAIIFDMDGVLANTMPIHFQTQHQALKEVGIDIAMSEIEANAGVPTKEMYQKFKEEKGLDFDIEKAFQRKIFLVNSFFRKEVEPIPGVVDLINQIQKAGFKIGLATSSPRETAEIILKTIRIHHYFEIITSFEDITKGKPDPEIFLLAAKKLGVNPEECVVVEDTRAGVTSAKAAGLKCVAFRNHHSGNQDLSQADLVIENFENLEIDQIKNL